MNLKFKFGDKVLVNDNLFYINVKAEIIGYNIGLDMINVSTWIVRFDNGHEDAVRDEIVKSR